MPYKILIGVPSSGTISEGAAQAPFLASNHHLVDRVPSCLSGPNFNNVWCMALNAGAAKEYTHFAMMHTDFNVIEDEPGLRWADRLIEEMDKVDADFISTPMAIKDLRGLTSSGIGNPANRWNPWRRFTVKELSRLPVTFNAADVGYGDKFLLHNEALCIFDLRKPLWYIPDSNGSCRCLFNFTEDIRLVDGKWCRAVESEDWSFSRNLWEMGARDYISTRIKTIHHGGLGYENHGDAGLWDQDHDTKGQWADDSEEQKGFCHERNGHATAEQDREVTATAG